MARSWEAALAVACLASLLLTPVLRRLAHRTGFVDTPAARKSHTAPVPYLGGVAIAVGTLAGFWIGSPSLGARFPLAVGGAALVALVGLTDDRRDLGPGIRLLVEVGAACLAVAGGVRAGLTDIPVLDGAITVAWIVLVANAFNLLDNMDGLCAGVATVAASGATWAAVHNGQLVIGALAAALAGACWGFLAYNARPATIYMGDAGSLFLGFLLAVVVVEVDSVGGGVDGAVAAALLVAVAVADTSTVVVARRRNGISVLVGGKDHLSHRLVASGRSTGRAVLVLAALQVPTTLLGVGVATDTIPTWAGALGGLAVVAVVCSTAWRVAVYPAAGVPAHSPAAP